MERPVGKGKVIFYGQDVYPEERSLRDKYEIDLEKLAADAVQCERQKGWIEGTKDVDFSVYDCGHICVIYLLNILWGSVSTIARAKLLLGNKSFPIVVPFGAIKVITIIGDWAIKSENDDVDILQADIINGGVTFIVQADGPSQFELFCSRQPHQIMVTTVGCRVDLKKRKKSVWEFTALPGKIIITT